jgi:hypothetical protein
MIFSLITVLLILAPRLTHGQGIIIQHSGFNNPDGEGFIRSGFGSSQATGITNDLGVNSWVTPVSISGILYTGSISNISSLAWILSVNVRVVTTNTGLGIFYLSLGTGSSSFGIIFGSDGNNDPIVGVGGKNYVLNGGSTYNNYQLVYDPGTETTSFWINGTEELSGILGQPEFGSSLAFLEWGGGYQNSGNFQANWNSVSLQIVPEPSTSWLILIGSGALIYIRNCNRKHSVPAKQD